MALTGTKALTVWCKQVTNGYKDVEIRNMTSCWRDGLAFCAMLHHYRPDLINFDRLSKENIAENNHLAFTVAEQELGIPALLDVEDMVELTVPDKLSILTYVSQYYNYFKDKVPGEIPTRHASKRQSPYTVDDLPKKKQATSVPGMSAAKEVIGATPTQKIAKGTMDRFCANCGKTVYLMERLQVEGKLFHRVCFKCNTCETQLRMGSYRYIPVEEHFYCDKHYRKRTTSTSSDDSSKSRNGNQKSEQDALQVLLESLENKRKSTKKIEDDTKGEEDKNVMKQSSVHGRIANARKKFMETEEPMELDHETGHKQCTQKEDLKSPTSQSPSHAPQRPTAPPERPPFDPKKKGADSSQNPGALASAKTNLQNEIAKHMPPLSQPHSKTISKEAKKEPPGRPPSLPKESNKESKGANEQNVQSKMQARGFLSNVIPKMNPPKHHEYANVPAPHERAKMLNKEEQGDKGEKKSKGDKGKVNIYEKPFAASVNEEENRNQEFDNPRYEGSLKLDQTPIYSNQGSSLLKIGNQNKDLEHKSVEEASKDHDEGFRPKSDSVSSAGGKKKKLVLKVKKKKHHDESSPRDSMNLDVDDAKAKGEKVEDTGRSSEGQRQVGGEGSEQVEDKSQKTEEEGENSVEKEEQKEDENVQVEEESTKGDKEEKGLVNEDEGAKNEGQKAEFESQEAKDEGQGANDEGQGLGVEGNKVKNVETDVEDLNAEGDKIATEKLKKEAAGESRKVNDDETKMSDSKSIDENPREGEVDDVVMINSESENIADKEEEGNVAARKSDDKEPEKGEENMGSDEQMMAGGDTSVTGGEEEENVKANEVEMKEEEGMLIEGEETVKQLEQNLDENKKEEGTTTARGGLITGAEKIERDEPEEGETKKVLKYVNPFEDSDEEMMPVKDNNKRKEKIVLNPFEVDTDDDLDNDDEDIKFDSSEEFVWDESIGRAVSRRAKLVPGEGPKTTMSAEEFAKHLKKIDDLKKGLAKTGNKDNKNPFEESDDELDQIHDKRVEKPKKQDGKPKLLVLKTKKKKRAPPPPTQAPSSQAVDAKAKEVVTGESTGTTDMETSVIIKTQEQKQKPEQKHRPEQISVAPNANLAPKDPLQTFKTYVDNSEAEIRKRLDSKSDGLRRHDDGQVDRATSPVSASCPALDKVFGDDRSIKTNNKSSSSDHLPENNERHEHKQAKTGTPQKNDDQLGEGKKQENEAIETTPELTKKKEKPPKRPAPPVPKGLSPFKDSPPSTPKGVVRTGPPDSGKQIRESPVRPDEIKKGDGLEHSKKTETPYKVEDQEKVKKRAVKTKSPKEKDKIKDKGREEKDKSKDKGKEEKDQIKDKGKEEKDKSKDKGREEKDKIKDKGREEKDKSKDKGREEKDKGREEKDKSKIKEKEGKGKSKEKVKEEEDKEQKKQKKDKQKEKNVDKNKSPKTKIGGDKEEEFLDEQKTENVGLARTYSIIEEKELTIDDIGIELKEIESKQQVLETKGVNMEKRLREILHGEPEEGYMITWFDLVTEKNRLLRRENELIYMSQEIEYRNNQKRIEVELRHLMEKEESTKTEEDRKAEEMLLDQLVNYVSRRNKIVEKIEQDRRREREEDEQIQMILQAQGLSKKHKKKKAGKKNSAGTTFYA